MTTTYMSKVAQGWGASQTCAYCHGFAKIPPLIRGSDGEMYTNPDFEMVKFFAVRAEPFGAVLAPGAEGDFAFTVPPEEENLGDLLVNELLALFTPDTTRNITIELLSTQTTRNFQNAPIFNTLILGNAQLSCCLPCCTLVQATNSLLMRVTNQDTVPVAIRVVARGKRFVPKSEELRARMLMYWNQIPSYPYYLTLDPTEVVVPAGGNVTTTMTVQGTGDFEIKRLLTEVIATPGGGGPPNANQIEVQLTEQVGRELLSDFMPLGAFVATPTIEVPGFPGGLYRAASACHCPPMPQLLKRNTRLRVEFRSTSAFDARVRLTFAGCFHQVPECQPGRSMDRARSLEPTIGPLMIPQRDYCPPQAVESPPLLATQPLQQPFPVVVPQQVPQLQVVPQQVPQLQVVPQLQGMGQQARRRPAAPGVGQRLHPGQAFWDPYTQQWKVI